MQFSQWEYPIAHVGGGVSTLTIITNCARGSSAARGTESTKDVYANYIQTHTAEQPAVTP